MTSQPVSSIFLCFSLLSGTWRTLRPVHFLMLSSHPLSSSPFHCALQGGVSQTQWTGNTSITTSVCVSFTLIHFRQNRSNVGLCAFRFTANMAQLAFEKKSAASANRSYSTMTFSKMRVCHGMTTHPLWLFARTHCLWSNLKNGNNFDGNWLCEITGKHVTRGSSDQPVLLIFSNYRDFILSLSLSLFIYNFTTLFRIFRSLYLGKASWDRVALSNLRCVLGLLVLP